MGAVENMVSGQRAEGDLQLITGDEIAEDFSLDNTVGLHCMLKMNGHQH